MEPTKPMQARNYCVYYAPAHPLETLTNALAFFLAQTADTLFFPFFRRGMGKGFWGFKQVVIGLVLFPFAVGVRLGYPQLMLTMSNFFPRSGRHTLAVYQNPVSEGVPADGYFARFVFIPLAIFWAAWLVMALVSWWQARVTTAQGFHTQLAGVSRLERVFTNSASSTVQRFYEPLVLVLVGFLVGAISPALGTVIFWGAVPYFVSQNTAWRAIAKEEEKARDTMIGGNYQQDTFERASKRTPKTLTVGYATRGPEPKLGLDTSPESLEEALKDIPEEYREKFLENLKRK